MNLLKKTPIFFITSLFLFVSCNKDDDSIVKPTEPTIQIPTEIAIDSIQIFNQTKSGQAEADRLGLRFSFSDFTPTGIYVQPNKTLKLELNLMEGSELPDLLIDSYSRGSNWNKQPEIKYLNNGINEIFTGDNGGMVYIRYTTNYNPTSKVNIKFLNGWKHTPYFQLNNTSNQTWVKMLNYFKEA